MKVLKDMIKSALISIIMSITIFVLVGVIIDITNHGVFTLENYMFSKMILACIFVGLGFGIPSVIYQFENIPLISVIFLIPFNIICTFSVSIQKKEIN